MPSLENDQYSKFLHNSSTQPSLFSLSSLTSIKTFIRLLLPHQDMLHALKQIDCSFYHFPQTNYFKSSHHHELEDLNYCSHCYSAPQLIHIHNIWHDVLSDGFLPHDATLHVSVDHQICPLWIQPEWSLHFLSVSKKNQTLKLFPQITLDLFINKQRCWKSGIHYVLYN